jgi:hypothetical protein
MTRSPFHSSLKIVVLLLSTQGRARCPTKPGPTVTAVCQCQSVQSKAREGAEPARSGCSNLKFNSELVQHPSACVFVPGVCMVRTLIFFLTHPMRQWRA